MPDPYKNVTIHDFKTNFSRYLCDLQDRMYKGIIIHRYKKKLAMCLLLPSDVELKGNAARAALAAHYAARERHKEQRRLHRARMMGHPRNHYAGWWLYDDSQL